MENKEQKSNRANKIFYTILTLLVLISLGITFYKIVILKDYQIVAQVSCDRETEKCFQTICNPIIDETCSAASTIADRTSYYKKISKKAATILSCEASTEVVGCNEELSCTEGELNCFYIYCDSKNLNDGEQCSE